MNFHNFQTQLRLFNSAVILITTLLTSPALLAPVFTSCTYPSPQSDIPQIECQALLDLYNSTGGPSWTDNATNNWNVTNTPCSWTGVTCSLGKVTQIDRNTQNLIGTLPASLSTLTNLTVLNLSYNSLINSIPSLPASLNQLRLEVNNLSGNIPSLPTNLTVLDLGGNSLSGSIPTSLPTSLNQLRLGANNLSGNIPNLPASLTWLWLNNNRLTGTIPPLPATLTALNLSNNAFTGTLPSFASLTSLVSPNLDLAYNLFQGPYPGEAALVSSKQLNWQNTQTVPPTGLSATALSATSVQVNWTPITYTADGGYYRVKYATTPGGPYTNASTTTANKSVSSYTVTGLTPGTPYYFFVVETFTPAHSPQQNNLTSILLAGQETSITTCPATTTVTSTADSGPNTLRAALTSACPSDTVVMNVGGNPIGLTSNLNITQSVTIDANNQVFNVTGGNFVAPGKNITITNASNINVVIIDTSTSSSTPAGNISLTATGIIMLQSLHADSDSTGNAGKGGDITVNAGGNIFLGDVFSYSKAISSTTDNGGDIAITSGGSVAVGSLLAASGGATGSGNSGSINVQATGGSITSSGYLTTYSSHGAANIITLTANTFLKIMGSNTGKSIIANGAVPNGIITITTGTSPFTVGDATTNGTQGDIYQSATNNMTASPMTTLPPYYPPAGININNLTCQNAITVTSTADSGAGSLRDAMISLCPGGTITLNASPIDLTSGELVINKDMTLTTVGGVNQTVQRSGTLARIFNIASGIVQINNLTITNGNSSISNNGGGIYIALGANLTLNNSTVLGNTAVYGGGLYNDGTTTVTNSTVSGNTGSDGGGGIYNNGTLTVTNSTFSANIAGIPTSYGGGIKNTGTGVLTVTNSTFSGNSAGWSSGGGGISNSGSLGLANTIIANSMYGGDCMSGTFTVNTNNLVEDGSCGSPLNISGDPLLGPLQNNGGMTPTFELLAGSPAIDAGDNASCPTTDQRGLPRPLGSLCDIGAYEFQYSQLTLVMGAGGSSVAVSPLGVNCGTDCNAYVPNTTVTLTATPAAGYTFSGWTGTNCADSLTVSTDTTCTANFTLIATPPPVVITDPLPPTSEPVVCADQLTVTSTADNNAGSLREAIATLCPGGTITIKASPIELTSGELLITKNLTMTTDQGYKTIQRSDTAAPFRLFRILAMATVNFNRLTFTQGNAGSENGGGIANSGDLTVDDCVITANAATDGGGIYNEGTLRLTRSTMLANSANNSGGGIHLAKGTSIIANTTFSSNSATQGGGLYVNSPATATVLNSTFADNLGGGITFVGELVLHNSLLAHHQGSDCVKLGTLAESSNNLIEDGSCQATFSGDPLFAPVETANSSSSSQLYYALLADSPAIGAGDVSICAATPVNGLDQRGVSRSPDHCDIGAYEYFTPCEEQSEIPIAECQALVDLYQNSNGSDWNDYATNRWLRTTTPCAWLGVKCENGHVVQIYRDSQNLVGTLPDLTTLDNLTALLLPNNTLTNLEVTQLPTSLQTLNLSNTGLTGNFPDVSSLPQLQILKLADNGLTGTLTADYLPNNLQELDVTHNQLTGALPDLSQFNQLQRLLLGRNSFEGVTEFNFHPQLTTLIVSNNALRGELPDSLHKFNQLTTLDLGYNAWWAKNDSVAEFLSTKQFGWEMTQTVPPTQVQAMALSDTTIQLTWIPILYTGDGGYYEVRYATQPGGPFDSPTGITADKMATGYTVLDLQPETTYYFIVRSFTPAHGNQANELFSDWTAEVSATTAQSKTLTPARYHSLPEVGSVLDFGSLPLGTAMTRFLTISKIGGEETLMVSNPVISGPHAADFQLISPTFPIQIQMLSLEGIASVGEKGDSSKIQMLSLEGIASVNGEGIAAPVDGEEIATVDELGESTTPVEAVGEVTVTIQCTPTAEGERQATLQFTSNDPLQPAPIYQLLCQGMSLPTTAQYTVDLGVSPLNTPITATLPLPTDSIIGSTPTVEVSEIVGPDAADFRVTAVPDLNTATGALTVQCTPSKLGLLSATLSVSRRSSPLPDAATSSLIYALSCTGILPTVENLPPTSSDLTPSDSAEEIFIPVENSTGNTIGTYVSSTQIQTLAIDRLAVEIRTANSWGRALQMVGTETVKVTGYLQPFSEHLGKVAEILVTYHWLPADSDQEMHFPLLLSGQLLTLDALGKMAIPLYQGQLVGLTGTFEVGIGYRLPEEGTFFADRVASLTLLPNHPPTAITLSNQTVTTNSPPDTVIGTFHTTDSDPGESFIYTLTTLDEKTHFHPFKIVGNELRVAMTSLLTVGQPQLTVKSLDAAGDSLERTFTLSVVAAPVSVTAKNSISLTHRKIAENSPIGTAVGRLFTLGETPKQYRYTLLDDAQGAFTLADENKLVVANPQRLDFETQPQLTVMVQRDLVDNAIATTTQTFEITVDNVIDVQLQSMVYDAQGQLVTAAEVKADTTFNLELIPEQAHLGQAADLIAIAEWYDETKKSITPTQSFQFSQEDLTSPLLWQPWPGHLEELVPFQTNVTLPAKLPLLEWQGEVQLAVGQWKLYGGYFLNHRDTVYLSEALNIQCDGKGCAVLKQGAE